MAGKPKSNQLDKPDTTGMSLVERRMLQQKEFAKAIKSKFGDNSIAKASEFLAMPRISTGILNLDIALGGGIGARNFTMVYGAESCFKTTLVYKLIADVQKRSLLTNKYIFEAGLKGDDLVPKKAAYINLEGTFDKNWAEKNGVKVEELEILTAVTAEDAGDMLISMVESGLYSIIVLDSLAQMVSEKEFESSMQDQNVGVTAKLNNSLFRKIQARFNSKDAAGDKDSIPAVVIINQPRQKIGIMFGSPETLPGGEGQKFYMSTSIRLSGNKVKYYDKDGQYPKSASFSFKIVKNKLAAPKVEGDFEVALVDDPEDEFKTAEILEKKFVIEQAEITGIIQKKDNNKWLCFGEEFNTKGELLKNWIENTNRCLIVKREVLKKLFPKQ